MWLAFIILNMLSFLDINPWICREFKSTPIENKTQKFLISIDIFGNGYETFPNYAAAKFGASH